MVPSMVSHVARFGRWLRASTGGGAPRPRRLGAGLAVLLVGATTLVAISVRSTPEPVADRSVPVPVRTAVTFAVESVVPDAERRTAAIRRWVLPGRAGSFVDAYEQFGQDSAARWRRVQVTPIAYRIVEQRDEDTTVLVYSSVRRTAVSGSAGPQTWELSGYGVIENSDRWWVYAYFGTETDYAPNDDALRSFTVLPGGNLPG